MASSRIPRGYERNSNLVREFLEISEGQRPALALKPAQYLPVKYLDKYLNDWVVVSAGTIVSVDASGDLVNCNGGAATAYTYTSDDIGITVDYNDGGHDDSVTAAGATSAAPGNKPIGVAPYDYYQNISVGFDSANPTGLTKYTNYQIQDKVAILCDYLIEVPVKTACDASGTIMAGDLVQSDVNGGYVKWTNANDVSQIVGRCIHRKAVAAVDNLDKVQTVPGLGLSGSDTAGIPQHLYNYSPTLANPAYTSKMLIQLMVA
jgi:hypothetical protein